MLRRLLFLLVFIELSSDLDGHLIVLPGGETAIQTVDGNAVLRLQLDKSGNAVLYGSPDGGATWPTSETVITNADLDGRLAFLSGGETALEAGSGNTRYRLQIDTVGNVLIFKSTDGGSTWPTSKVIASM